MVAKLLTHGRERGFMTIEVRGPYEDALETALRLKQHFGLTCARVVYNTDAIEGEVIKQADRVDVDVVTQFVSNGTNVGIPWGYTISVLTAHPTHAPHVDVRVVQLKGEASLSEKATHNYGATHSFRGASNVGPRYLSLPVIFQDMTMLSIVHRDRVVKRILEKGRGVDVAVFTVGSLGYETLSLSLDQPEDDETETLLRGAVEDTCSRFSTHEGSVALTLVGGRTVDIMLDELYSHPVWMLVAGGCVKTKALDTTFHMELITHLVVDQDLTLALLERSCGTTPREVRDRTLSG